jgi:hypothetical protein
MGSRVILWELRDQEGYSATCALIVNAARWGLAVRRGRELLLAERHTTEAAALARAAEIWSVCREIGWTEPIH